MLFTQDTFFQRLLIRIFHWNRQVFIAGYLFILWTTSPQHCTSPGICEAGKSRGKRENFVFPSPLQRATRAAIVPSAGRFFTIQANNEAPGKAEPWMKTCACWTAAGRESLPPVLLVTWLLCLSELNSCSMLQPERSSLKATNLSLLKNSSMVLPCPWGKFYPTWGSLQDLAGLSLTTPARSRVLGTCVLSCVWLCNHSLTRFLPNIPPHPHSLAFLSKAMLNCWAVWIHPVLSPTSWPLYNSRDL